MRILVIQESDWLEVGPHQSHHLMERMVVRGHDVRVIDFEIRWRTNGKKTGLNPRQIFDNMYKVLEGGGVTVFRPAFLRIPWLDYVTMAQTHTFEIRRQLIDFRPDIVVGFGLLNSSTAMRLCHKRGIPFVLYLIDVLHELVPQRNLQSLAKIVERNNIARADCILTINKTLRDYVLNMGARSGLVEVIPAGVDLETFENAEGASTRKELGISDDDILLFYMGWLYHFSGLTEVAEEIVKRNDKRVKLLVVGKGDSWEDLREIEKKEAKESLILLGWKPYSEIPRYIKASDICILPSHDVEIMRNIVPIKIYEYLASGKPVISTKLNGLVTEFGEDSGIAYVNNPSEVLDAVMEINAGRRIKEMGEGARRAVENNGWDRICDRFERVIADLSRDSTA